MEFIDSHCHLYSDQFSDDRQEAINNAKALGVSKIVLPNIDADSVAGMWDLCRADPHMFFPSIGLHPCSVKEDYKEQLSILKQSLETNTYVSIGEIGLDLYWDKTFFNEQKEAFLIQCQWAKEHNLPIIIHTRNSFDEIFELLDSVHDEKLRGVFHCFSGTQVEADKILTYGNFYLGVGGVLTFKNAKLDRALVNVPLNKILLETDSPYLAPTPHRGKRNEPKFLWNIAEKLAEVYSVPLAEIAAVTTKNSNTLFGI
jgi:TatD DNase family protein